MACRSGHRATLASFNFGGIGMKMQKDGVTFEELEELAAQVNFPLNSEEDYLKLFRTARSLGWWPELDRPKIDTKRFWVPPVDDIRYRPNPWYVPDSAPKKQRVKSAAMQQKEASAAELERLSRLIKALEADPRAKDLVELPLQGVKELDSWLDDIK